MQYTTQGLMTAADLVDHQRLTDTGPYPGCPGHYEDPGPIAYCSVADDCPADRPETAHDVEAQDFYTSGWKRAIRAAFAEPQDRITLTNGPLTIASRLSMYQAQNGTHKITAAQRRRLLKKAGRDRDCRIFRWEGMGYPRSRQGEKQLGFMPRPVSGAPV